MTIPLLVTAFQCHVLQTHIITRLEFICFLKSTSLGSSTITLITLLRHGVMESRNSLNSRWAAACPCLHLLALLLGEHDRFYFYPLKGALPLKRL